MSEPRLRVAVLSEGEASASLEMDGVRSRILEYQAGPEIVSRVDCLGMDTKVEVKAERIGLGGPMESPSRQPHAASRNKGKRFITLS